ncbi:MAG: DNA polymerase/3'-5' exonuclease PolX [Phycisphaeraceae bacterium]|nr:DNA polymerase/3'-5' exonuclease PolX [Phycisphaeraceae bacterium]
MSVNQALAAKFEQIAAMLELTGADPFRVNAHRKAARVIEESSEDYASLADDRDALLAIEGVGQKTADKIIEFVTTGDIAEHAELCEQVPSGLLDILEIPGLGPKTVKALWEELKVVDVEGLKRVIDDGSILTLPRMGAKSVEKIKAAIAFSETSGGRTPLGIALPLAERFAHALRVLKGVDRCEFAGSLRRGKDTIGDIDLVVSAKSSHAEAIGEAFRTMPEVKQVLAAGETKSSVRAVVNGGALIQIDLRIVEPAQFGAALLYFTGSKEHNVRLRERAQKKGLTLNEYGLFKDDGEPAPQNRGKKPIASETEQAIYDALDAPAPPPELREDQGELSHKAGHDFDLITLDDIKAELHAHTTASDGALSIIELATEAKRRGFHTIAVTDHSKSQKVAGGLDKKRLLAHIEAIHAARDEVEGIAILAGSEVDIMPDGSLDYDDNLLAKLDIVVASPHWSLAQKPEEATARLLKAIEHPLVDIIGHPTGRLINRREGLAPSFGELFAAAVEHDTAMEINSHWLRLDLRDTHARAAIHAGVKIAIDCDVHSITDFEHLRFGVLTARRAGASPKHCLNAWTKKKLHDWLRARRR